jgi:cytochrome c-type biogenesis protein CcmH/NrfG
MTKNSANRPKKARKAPLKKQFVFLCSCCAVVFLLFIAGLNLEKVVSEKRVLGARNEESITAEALLAQQKTFWEKFTQENPTYLEGWVELANISFQMGNQEEALVFLEKAKTINQNSEKVKALEEKYGL